MLSLILASTVLIANPTKAEPWTWDAYCATAFQLDLALVGTIQPDGSMKMAKPPRDVVQEMNSRYQRAVNRALQSGASPDAVDRQIEMFRSPLRAVKGSEPGRFSRLLETCRTAVS